MKHRIINLIATLGVCLSVASLGGQTVLAQTTATDLRAEALASVEIPPPETVPTATDVRTDIDRSRPDLTPETNTYTSDIDSSRPISDSVTESIGDDRANLHASVRANIRANTPLDDCLCDCETTPPLTPPAGGGPITQPEGMGGGEVTLASTTLPSTEKVAAATITTPSETPDLLPDTGNTPSMLPFGFLAGFLLIALGSLLHYRKRLTEAVTYRWIQLSTIDARIFWQRAKLGVASLVVSAFPFFQMQMTPRAVASELPVQTLSSVVDARVEGTPTRIVINRLGVDVAIVAGGYNQTQKSWSVADKQANYDVNSAAINSTTGSTLIYGHNDKDVLGKTTGLQVGDIAIVYTSNNQIVSYRYTGDEVVKPENTKVLDTLDDKAGLSLVTCEGTWAQNRRVMSFEML